MNTTDHDLRETLAKAIHGLTCHLIDGESCNEPDEFDYDDADDLAAALVPLLAHERAQAWDEGYHEGWRFENRATNPYRAAAVDTTATKEQAWTPPDWQDDPGSNPFRKTP